METDFRTLPARPGIRSASRRLDDRCADVGWLLITCPDRPGIVAAVSSFLFASGANITESQQYSTNPFGGTFFLRVEFHLDALAGRFDDLLAGFGQLADKFSMRWKMTRAGELKRVATAHYVTAELDAGPIIEQDIVRVDHRSSADDLRQLGRHVERAVLARAVGWHLADRVIVHQNKTIVFT